MDTTVPFVKAIPIESTQPHTTEPFAQVPVRALEKVFQGEMGASVFFYYSWLCRISNSEGKSWWSIEKQAELFGVTPRTIMRWRSLLVEIGYINRTERRRNTPIITVVHHPQRLAALGKERHQAENPSALNQPTPKPDHQSDQTTPRSDIADVTIFAAASDTNETELTTDSDFAAAATADSTEKQWDRLCTIFGDVGVDLRGCRAYVFQRLKQTQKLLDAWDGALRHAAWVLLGRIRRSGSRIGAPLRITIAIEALETAPPMPLVEQKENQSKPANAPIVEKPYSNFEKWSEVLATIEERVTDSTYNRWFRRLGAYVDDQKITFICEDEFDAEFTEKNFSTLLAMVLGKVGIKGALRFTCDDEARRLAA